MPAAVTAHPFGLSMTPGANPFRMIGAMGTILVMLALIAIVLWQSLSLLMIAAIN